MHDIKRFVSRWRPDTVELGALKNRLHESLARLNPGIPKPALEDALRKVTRTETPSLVENNRRFHRLLTDGVDVEYRRADGSIAGDKVWLFDFARPERNDWLVVNQFTVIENQHNRRPDLVVFVNGIPLAVLELKNPGDENAGTERVRGTHPGAI